MTTKYRQFSVDKEKWYFGGAKPFKWARFITVKRDDKGAQTSRVEEEPFKIKETTRDPAAFGYEKE